MVEKWVKIVAEFGPARPTLPAGCVSQISAAYQVVAAKAAWLAWRRRNETAKLPSSASIADWDLSPRYLFAV